MKVAYRSKNELAYELLRKAIIGGEYKPGSRLVIDQLAEELGISQIPIREAIRQLEGDGFVTIEPYIGVTITPINADFIFEIFALLESIEVTCSRTACCYITDAEMETLASMIQNMDSSVADPDQWSQENKDLHLFICECARSTLSKTIIQNVLDHWDRLRLHYLQDVFGKRIKAAQQEHKQILQAFRTRNPDEVERMIREHNQHGLAGYIQHLKSAGHITEEVENCR